MRKTSLKQSGTVFRHGSSSLSLSVSLSLSLLYTTVSGQVLIWLLRSPFISFLFLAPTTINLVWVCLSKKSAGGAEKVSDAQLDVNLYKDQGPVLPLLTVLNERWFAATKKATAAAFGHQRSTRSNPGNNLLRYGFAAMPRRMSRLMACIHSSSIAPACLHLPSVSSLFLGQILNAANHRERCSCSISEDNSYRGLSEFRWGDSDEGSGVEGVSSSSSELLDKGSESNSSSSSSSRRKSQASVRVIHPIITWYPLWMDAQDCMDVPSRRGGTPAGSPS
ncbi:hypothetical protein C4D60_Mb06t22960 [Musa balbisiana]|uniref:Uncharacterized protein n=1 Tax=Musa balbisiana TaxID=52838 RepID=A0A4S8IQ19_MUSBA|nr:hypothetical protein C4D60_Mb06t22960 [Musa balbisiana]